MLFDSLVKSNPKHAPDWIAAACLEEHACRMVAAKKLIEAGCEQCPKSHDYGSRWQDYMKVKLLCYLLRSLIFVIENDDAKVILANAVQHVSQSVKI